MGSMLGIAGYGAQTPGFPKVFTLALFIAVSFRLIPEIWVYVHWHVVNA